MIEKIFQAFHTIYQGAVIVLKDNLYKILTGLFFVGLLFLYIMLPVWLVPGNDFLFQISIFGPWNLLFLVILSALTAILITMQVYLFTKVGRKAFYDGGGSVISGVFATLVGTASCVGCSLGVVFGVLGFGMVFFLTEYQIYIASGAVLVLIMALWLIARRIVGHCLKCEILNE